MWLQAPSPVPVGPQAAQAASIANRRVQGVLSRKARCVLARRWSSKENSHCRSRCLTINGRVSQPQPQRLASLGMCDEESPVKCQGAVREGI